MSHNDDLLQAALQQIATLSSRLDSTLELVQSLSNEVISLKSVESQRKLQSGVTTISSLNSGDTAWMLTSTALVLFMSIPGLALYYGGMTREKNVLSTTMQTFTIACLVTVTWICFGYSLAFSPSVPATRSDEALKNDFSVYGDASRFWLQGMHLDSYHINAPTIPEAVYCAYQLCFAIISSALICGSFAERMEYRALCLFTIIWHITVHCPLAHAVWHPDGFLYQSGALDYAGGCVIHIASGVSGLVCAVYLGKRTGWHPKSEEFEPHNILLSLVGASMLWVGWFGFNAGSANGANERAGYAILMTQIATATAALAWILTDWFYSKHPSVLGIISGAISGLVAITPASGYVDVNGAFFIGLLAGPLCYGGAQLKHYLGYDDSLDAFGVHAIGGIVGSLLTGFFVTSAVQINPPINGVFYGSTLNGGTQLALQLYAVVISVFWSGICTSIIMVLLDYTIGVRVSLEVEEIGLDFSHHRANLSSSSLHTYTSDKLGRSRHHTPLATLKPLEQNENSVDSEVRINSSLKKEASSGALCAIEEGSAEGEEGLALRQLEDETKD